MRARWVIWGVVLAGCGVEFTATVEQGEGGASAAADDDTSDPTQGGSVTTGSGGQAGDGGAPPDGGAGGEGGAPICSEQPCRLMAPQCGCPQGQKCTIDAYFNRMCSAFSGNGQANAACSTDADCAEGFVCTGHFGSQLMCEAFCGSDADCTAGPGSKCIWKDPATSISMICTTQCDLTSDAGCRPGDKCTFVYDSAGISGWGTTCSAMGTVGLGGSCTAATQCGPGMMCANGQCRPVCSSVTACASGSCYTITPAIKIGTVDYGVCF